MLNFQGLGIQFRFPWIFRSSTDTKSVVWQLGFVFYSLNGLVKLVSLRRRLTLEVTGLVGVALFRRCLTLSTLA